MKIIKFIKRQNKYTIIVAVILIIFFTLFSFWPFMFNFVISFAKTNLISEYKWVGFRNYIYLLKDPIFLQALWHNIYYLVVMLTGGIFTSLIIAVLISRTSGILKRLYTSFFFIPVITSLVAISVVWKLLYFPKTGIIALFLTNSFGIEPQTFLNDPKIALLCIIIMDIWRDTGIRVVILLAGINAIPVSIYESSRIDGASPLSQFFKITIPLLRPQIAFIIAIYSINAIRIFLQVYMLSYRGMGGPMNATITLAIHMYQSAFYNLKFGYGGALAMVMFFMLVGIVMFQIRAFKQSWDY